MWNPFDAQIIAIITGKPDDLLVKTPHPDKFILQPQESVYWLMKRLIQAFAKFPGVITSHKRGIKLIIRIECLETQGETVKFRLEDIEVQ